MGSLALAGALTGAGQGIVQGVENRQAVNQADLERSHETALERMRNSATASRDEAQRKHDFDFYDKQRTDVVSDLEADRTNTMNVAKYERDTAMLDREDEQEHAMRIEAMKLFQESVESGSTSVKSADGKWEMKVLTDTVQGPNGIPVEQDRFVMREPGSPLVLEQFNNFMLPNGQTDEERETALQIARSGQLADAEQDLLSKAGTEKDDSSQFLEAYGYLPVAYYRKINKDAKGSKGFESFYRKFKTPAGIPETDNRGVLSEAEKLATGEDAVTKSVSTDTGDEPYKPESRHIPVTERRTPNVPPIADIPDDKPSALETLSDPDRVGAGFRATRDVITEKPWITNPIVRARMGLSLTPEQAAVVAAHQQQEQTASR